MLDKLGKFQIQRLLGQGAMGEVYLGLDPSIGREVAIKTILPAAAQGDEAKARFEREAKAAGTLNHPHLVTIYEFGEDQGVLYLAMEYVKGQDLEELFREQSLSRTETLEVLAQVCDGLGFAHQHGIVHRDIKPSNIRVTRDGKRLHAKVMDFGVARVGDSDMTATGMVMGTVNYMAPEYIRTGKPDPRSDLFAVGVMLYEALSGRKPFAGDTTPTILYRIVHEAPEPIDLQALAGLSPAIRPMLDKALEKDPDRRFQTAEALAKALRAAKDPTWQGDVEPATTRVGAGAATAVLAPRVPTQPMAPPRRSKAGLVLAIGAAAVVLMGAGGYAAWKGFASRPALAAPAESLPLATPNRPTEEHAPAATAPTSGQPAHTAASPLPASRSEAPVTKPESRIEPRTESSPEPPAKAAQGSLDHLDVVERKNLSHLSLSEAIQLADKDPARAVEGMKAAIAANPGNASAYAWAVAVLYENGRYSEIPGLLAKARRQGISRSQLESNIRFRAAMQRERMNPRLPEGEL